MNSAYASDAGYTLSEMLAALVMIGLASGGLVEGTQVIGHIQAQAGRAMGDAQSLRSAQSGLDRLLEGQGPFQAAGGRLAGSSTGFSFDCGAARPCAARLSPAGGRVKLDLTLNPGTASTLLPPSAIKAAFAYGDAQGAGDTWPPADPGLDRLRSVVLRDGDGATLAAVRLWTEQPRRCQFDVIAQSCRAETPPGETP